MQAAGNFQGQLLEFIASASNTGSRREEADNVDEFTKNSGDAAAAKTADSLAHASSSGVGVAAALGDTGTRAAGRRRARRRGAVPKLLHRRRRAVRLGRRGDGTCPLVPAPHAGRVNPRADPDAQPTPKHPNRDTGADAPSGATTTRGLNVPPPMPPAGAPPPPPMPMPFAGAPPPPPPPGVRRRGPCPGSRPRRSSELSAVDLFDHECNVINLIHTRLFIDMSFSIRTWAARPCARELPTAARLACVHPGS